MVFVGGFFKRFLFLKQFCFGVSFFLLCVFMFLPAFGLDEKNNAELLLHHFCEVVGPLTAICCIDEDRVYETETLSLFKPCFLVLFFVQDNQ